MHGGKEKYVLGFVGKLKINHFEDLFVDVRVLLTLIPLMWKIW
jgi:hypothetical protein